MEPDPVLRLALFKFGKRQHIEQFVSEGLLYMNTLEYFTKLEAESVRRDPNEGVDKMWPARESRVFVKKNLNDAWTEVGPLAGPLQFRSRDSLAVNVFCMYGIWASTGLSLVDPRNFAFGDTFVLFKEGDEFLRRAKQAALDAGHDMECRAVEYVDETSYRGTMGPFRKLARFSYQSEFRCVLSPGTGAPYGLRLGSLSEIVAIIGPLADINSHINVVAD